MITKIGSMLVVFSIISSSVVEAKDSAMTADWKFLYGEGTNELSIYLLPDFKKVKTFMGGGWVRSAAFSPKQDRIAITSSSDIFAPQADLSLLDAAGNLLAKLGKTDLKVVSFDADGQEMILSKYEEEEIGIAVDLYKFDLTSRDEVRFCSLRRVSNYTEQLLSPDSNKLVYVDARRGIVVFHVVEGTLEELGLDGYSPVWSPTGEAIAFQGEDGNCYVSAPYGSKPRLVWDTNGYKDQIDLVWSPDGEEILASRLEGGAARWLTKKDGKELVYYVIGKDNGKVQRLGELK